MVNASDIRSRENFMRLAIESRINSRFSPMRSYLKYIDLSTDAADKIIDKQLDELLNRDDDSYDAKYLQLDVDERSHIRSEIPRLHFISFSLIAYSDFEKSLNDLCELAKNPTNLRLRDLAANGIVRAENFLRKICHVSAPFDGEDWEIALGINKLRNHWVHADENLTEKEYRRLKAVTANVPGIVIETVEAFPPGTGEWYLVSPSQDFCVFAIDLYKKIASNILEEISV